MISRWFLTRVVFLGTGVLGRILSDSNREKLERWFIGQNNRLVANLDKNNFRRVLLLLPHCLQNDGCKHRLTASSGSSENVLNCEKCGKCRISGLLTLSEKNNIIIKVATGGRLAKRIVGESSPDVVVAVACERELSEGIFSVYPLPVYGILNIRPSGPCINTDVDIKLVEKVLNNLLNKQIR